VHEGRRYFPKPQVRENLVATAATRAGPPNAWTLEKSSTCFSAAGGARRAFLAARSSAATADAGYRAALMTNPLLLLLASATEGLAPLVRA